MATLIPYKYEEMPREQLQAMYERILFKTKIYQLKSPLNNIKMSKKDNSPVVFQRDKLKEKLTIKELPWSERQKQFIDIELHKDTRLMFVNGPAGSSKTILSVFAALTLLNEKRISDVLYVRSAVESADFSLGYLPGTMEEKMAYYSLPFYDKLRELLPKGQIELLQKDERVSIHPVNFARGMSWNAKCLIIDESQNFSCKELTTILTRIGQFTRCFVLADPGQSDLHKDAQAFSRMTQLFDDEESRAQGIHVFTFTEEDIVRSELVKYLVKKFKEIK